MMMNMTINMTRLALSGILVAFAFPQLSDAWSAGDGPGRVSRRRALESAAAVAVALPFVPSRAAAAADTPFEKRNRNGNKDAVVREDYWYMMGRTPPRTLSGPLLLDDPQWNAFGSCVTRDGDASSANSCTYVSLKQRIPAYSKYGYLVGLGAREYQQLGSALRARDWDAADSLLRATSPPQPISDALLKMALLASALLTSPNYNGPSRELLVARYYVNEVSFAVREVGKAVAERDIDKALDVWSYGRDSWNSYLQIANGKISAKVGDKFEMIEAVL